MTSKNISLRAPEPYDVDLLYTWENDTSIWHLSNTVAPFSRFAIEQYVMNAHQDIYEAKQLRMMIDLHTPGEATQTIGTIDLFEFDPAHSRAGVGLLITSPERGKGYGQEALQLMIKYAFNTLSLYQLYCYITVNNEASLHLFKKFGFVISGTIMKWIKMNHQWLDVYFLQLLNEKTIK